MIRYDARHAATAGPARPHRTTVFDAIEPRSPTPLYEQIATQVRLGVASGEIGAGDALPSVRQLARTLRVNPATVVQAYRELESDGFVEIRHGAGTFVRDVPAFRKEEEMVGQAMEIAREALQEAARAGVSGAALLRAMREAVGDGTRPTGAGSRGVPTAASSEELVHE